MAKIDINLEELLAPIRQMSAEIQKMNEALRETARLQAQMRSAAGQYPDTKRGAVSQIQDLVAARGGPLPNNVYSIGTGSPIPPTNINPAGMPQSANSVPSLSAIASARQGINITAALAGQAGMQNPQSKKEFDELHKVLKNHTDKSGQLISNFLSKSQSDLDEVSKLLSEKKRELALAMADNSDNIKELTDAADELSKKFNTLNSAVETMADAAETFVKKAGGGGGDGSGGGGGSWWSKYGGAAKIGLVAAAQLTGIGFQTAGTYAGLQATGFNQNLMAAREIPQNIATAESLRFQKYMTTVAPTTGEQFVEAYGNLLFPGKNKFNFLGVGNRPSLQNTAAGMVKEELRASEAERSATTRSTLGNLLASPSAWLSAAGVVTGGMMTASGVGAAIGVPLMIASGGALASQVSGAYTTATQAQTGLAGQREGGVFNVTGAGLIHDNILEKKYVQQSRAATAMYASEEANQRMLLDSEKQRISARKMAMGIDENLAALRMQTAATAMAGGAAVTGFEAFKNLSPEKSQALVERYSSLGYSIPEVGQIYNQYASMMGTTQGAGRLVGLSRAGVGSVEQMAGNILGISASSGKVGDTKQLENIFAKAFEAGLKGAPAIQRFTQAAVEMSSALKLKSADSAATMLSTLTSAMAGKTGSPLMYLGEAQAGLSALAAATGTTSGLMGTMKVLSGASQGLGMGSLGLVSGSNIVQVQEALSQLSGPVKDYTKLTGLARQLVGSQVRAGLAPEDAIKKVQETLKAQSGAQTAPFAAGYKQLTGKDLSDVQAEAKKLLKEGKAEELRNLLGDFKGEAASITGLEGEGAAEALLLSGLSPSEFKKGKNILAQEKGKGAAKAAADFATVNYKRVLNKAALEAQGAIGREEVSEKELLETAKGLGIKGNKEQQISALREAAGVKEGEGLSFAKLATAISVISDKEGGTGGRVGILEAFGDTAMGQLRSIFGGNQSDGGSLESKPGPSAPRTPKARFSFN